MDRAPFTVYCVKCGKQPKSWKRLGFCTECGNHRYGMILPAGKMYCGVCYRQLDDDERLDPNYMNKLFKGWFTDEDQFCRNCGRPRSDVAVHSVIPCSRQSFWQWVKSLF